MRRGTTPRHVFETGLAAAEVKRVEITYEQNNKVTLVKTETSCEIKDSEISVVLTQEETLQFAEEGYIYIQLRVLLTDGTALASDVFKEKCEPCLSDEVLA